tara:strand:+ start:227 stop:487 length:261 start_codon:yes stop_codon:yes gene_type:complete
MMQDEAALKLSAAEAHVTEVEESVRREYESRIHIAEQSNTRLRAENTWMQVSARLSESESKIQLSFSLYWLLVVSYFMWSVEWLVH